MSRKNRQSRQSRPNCTSQPMAVGSLDPALVSPGNQAAAYWREATTSIATRLENAIRVMKPIR
ncbi:hypothetical protein D9M71_564510 [compost metagenome]